MADQRTFVLIGNFTDNITPALEKINDSISKLKANISSVSAVTKPLQNDFKELTSLSKDFNSSIKNQSADIKQMTTALRAFRSEMGKVNRSYKAGGNRMVRQAAGGGGGGPGGPSGPRNRSGSLAAAAGGAVAGDQLGNMITGSIVKGFELGANLMMKPFQYAAGAFGERIKDELTDIQSAGGMFAMDKRKKLGLFPDFQAARREQEAINYRLAQSAAALPGATAEYVQQGKRITDTMIGAMAKDPRAFQKLGEDYGGKSGDKMDALGAMIQKFTEKAVLLGKGSGGASKMYGMPQLLEMMINKDKINPQAMGAKYAVLRDNPLLVSALNDAEAEINKTGAGTADRIRAIMKVLDEALPNEVVQGMKNSMDGIIEVIRSSFLDPEVGLFGLGRKFAKIAPKVDQFGRYVDSSGKVVNDINLAAKDDLSLFILLKETIGGFALPLSELAQILPEIFDPLKNVANSLVKFRNIAQRFYANFNQYTAEFEALAKEIGGKKGIEIKRTAGARGALLSVANLLRGIGSIDMTKYNSVAKQLQEFKPNLGAITADLFKTLLNSDFMVAVGETIGGLFGSVVKMVGDMMSGATNFANAGPFAKGLKKGWDAAQGSKGVSDVFRSLFKIIGNVLMAAFKAAPLESSLVAALTVGMPLLSGLISAGITKLFESLFAEGGVGAIAEGSGAFLRLLGPIALVTAGLITLGGGLENTARQLGNIGGEVGSNTGDILKQILDGFAELKGDGKGKGGSVDWLKVLLFPLTGAFQALNLSILSIRQGFDRLAIFLTDMSLGLIRKFPWLTSKENRKRLEDQQKENYAKGAQTDAAMARTKMHTDLYNTPIRYGGTQGYGTVLDKDVLSKEQKKKTATGEELKKLTAELDNLKARQEMLKKDFGYKPTTPTTTPTPPAKPVVPGAKPTTPEVKPATDVQISTAFKTALSPTQSNTGQAKTTLGTISNTNKQSANTLTSINSKVGKDAAAMASIAASLGSINGKVGAILAALPGLRTPGTPTPTPNAAVPKTDLSPKFSKNQRNDGTVSLYKGGLGDAVASEMKNKPSGSGLVIANSSETVIPAAGGFGMKDFMNTLQSGFSQVANMMNHNNATLREADGSIIQGVKTLDGNVQQNENENRQRDQALGSTVSSNHQQTMAQIQQMNQKIATMSAGGMGGAGGGAMYGGGGGDIIATGKMLLGMGLQVGENPNFQYGVGYLPGGGGGVGGHAPGSYHYSGRALDVSGSDAQLDAAYARLKSTPYKELLWRTAGHYDHLHVAYALGQGNPAFFNSLASAQKWERSMMPAGAKLGSVTTNSSEGFGSNSFGDINVTVHAGSITDPDQLASMVAMKIGEAVADARSSSIFV